MGDCLKCLYLFVKCLYLFVKYLSPKRKPLIFNYLKKTYRIILFVKAYLKYAFRYTLNFNLPLYPNNRRNIFYGLGLFIIVWFLGKVGQHSAPKKIRYS
jgi:hypothetical protein